MQLGLYVRSFTMVAEASSSSSSYNICSARNTTACYAPALWQGELSNATEHLKAAAAAAAGLRYHCETTYTVNKKTGH